MRCGRVFAFNPTATIRETMPTIHLTTFIAAPADRVFDLCRHIGLHTQTMAAFKEEAVAGTRFGLIGNDETVTWKARHVGKTRLLRVKVSDMKIPEQFVVEQAEGDFKAMRHEYYCKPCDNGTILVELFHFETPYGQLGRWFNSIYLNRYLRKMLEQRNATLREVAESDKWKKLLLV